MFWSMFKNKEYTSYFLLRTVLSKPFSDKFFCLMAKLTLFAIQLKSGITPTKVSSQDLFSGFRSDAPADSGGPGLTSLGDVHSSSVTFRVSGAIFNVRKGTIERLHTFALHNTTTKYLIL